MPRLWAAWFNQSIFWPDEVYQSLEPAHTLVFGYGWIPWEWQDGARSWVFPAFFAGLWKVALLLGVSSAQALVLIARTSMALLGAAGVLFAMRFAERLSGRVAGVVAGLFTALFPALLVYSGRGMTEMASGPLLVLAALLALSSDRRRLLLAGGCAALTIYLRYQNGLLALSLLVWLCARRRWRDAAWFAASATAVGLAGGVLDWITWGAPFHSFIAYARFNLGGEAAQHYGAPPWTYYLTTAWTATGPAILVVVAGLVVAARRNAGLVLVLLVSFFALSLVPHKEYRFVMPLVPLALGLAGAGIGDALARTRSSLAWALAGVLVIASAVSMPIRAVNTTFAEMGQWTFRPQLGSRSPWVHHDGINKLLWVAGERPDLCGIAVPEAWAWIGGFSYLHRDVPFMTKLTQVELPAANYLISESGKSIPEGYQHVASSEGYMLVRRDGACRPLPYVLKRTWDP